MSLAPRGHSSVKQLPSRPLYPLEEVRRALSDRAAFRGGGAGRHHRPQRRAARRAVDPHPVGRRPSGECIGREGGRDGPSAVGGIEGHVGGKRGRRSEGSALSRRSDARNGSARGKVGYNNTYVPRHRQTMGSFGSNCAPNEGGMGGGTSFFFDAEILVEEYRLRAARESAEFVRRRIGYDPRGRVGTNGTYGRSGSSRCGLRSADRLPDRRHPEPREGRTLPAPRSTKPPPALLLPLRRSDPYVDDGYFFPDTDDCSSEATSEYYGDLLCRRGGKITSQMVFDYARTLGDKIAVECTSCGALSKVPQMATVVICPACGDRSPATSVSVSHGIWRRRKPVSLTLF